MATPTRFVRSEVEKIPKGKFWMGKSESAGTATQEVSSFMPERYGRRPHENERAGGSAIPAAVAIFAA
jgi:hypothetical protein